MRHCHLLGFNLNSAQLLLSTCCNEAFSATRQLYDDLQAKTSADTADIFLFRASAGFRNDQDTTEMLTKRFLDRLPTLKDAAKFETDNMQSRRSRLYCRLFLSQLQAPFRTFSCKNARVDHCQPSSACSSFYSWPSILISTSQGYERSWNDTRSCRSREALFTAGLACGDKLSRLSRSQRATSLLRKSCVGSAPFL